MITRRRVLQAALLVAASPGNAVSEINNINFAVIGDYGSYLSPAAWSVAKLVRSWNPDYIVTCGDNSYGMKAGATYAQNNEMYKAYIPDQFYPCLGNHDKDIDTGWLYSDFFGRPRFYTKTIGDVLLVSVDSNSFDMAQAKWAESTLRKSTARWKIIFFHFPPYVSDSIGGTATMRKPWHAWGADLVLCGNHHIYERINRPEGLYIINGLGGKSRYAIESKTPYSKAAYNENYGAMRITGGMTKLRLEFINLAGKLIDTATLNKPVNTPPVPTPPIILAPIIQLLLR